MKLSHLERLSALLATNSHTPQVRHIAQSFDGLPAGYYLDDTYIGKSANEAFTALVERVSSRLAWVDRDYPQTKISTRRGRG